MDRMDRPKVEKIEGIPPAIAIDRKDPVRTSRSTVGTMTEITDYVKLLYARLGQLHCRSCGKPVMPETPARVWKLLQEHPAGARVVITFPYTLESAPPDKIRKSLMQMGFDRLFIENRIVQLEDWQPHIHQKEVPVLADRLILRAEDRDRVLDSLELAFRFGGGLLDIWISPDEHYAFSNRLECADCKIGFNAPLPSLFSFNSPMGACDVCRGFIGSTRRQRVDCAGNLPIGGEQDCGGLMILLGTGHRSSSTSDIGSIRFNLPLEQLSQYQSCASST